MVIRGQCARTHRRENENNRFCLVHSVLPWSPGLLLCLLFKAKTNPVKNSPFNVNGHCSRSDTGEEKAGESLPNARIPRQVLKALTAHPFLPVSRSQEVNVASIRKGPVQSRPAAPQEGASVAGVAAAAPSPGKIVGRRPRPFSRGCSQARGAWARRATGARGRAAT